MLLDVGNRRRCGGDGCKPTSEVGRHLERLLGEYDEANGSRDVFVVVVISELRARASHESSRFVGVSQRMEGLRMMSMAKGSLKLIADEVRDARMYCNVYFALVLTIPSSSPPVVSTRNSGRISESTKPLGFFRFPPVIQSYPVDPGESQSVLLSSLKSSMCNGLLIQRLIHLQYCWFSVATLPACCLSSTLQPGKFYRLHTLDQVSSFPAIITRNIASACHDEPSWYRHLNLADHDEPGFHIPATIVNHVH